MTQRLCQGASDRLDGLFQAGEEVMPHLQRGGEAGLEIPRPAQVLVVCRVAEADQNRREPAVDEYEPAVVVAAIGKNLDRLQCDLRLHETLNEPPLRIVQE